MAVVASVLPRRHLQAVGVVLEATTAIANSSYLVLAAFVGLPSIQGHLGGLEGRHLSTSTGTASTKPSNCTPSTHTQQSKGKKSQATFVQIYLRRHCTIALEAFPLCSRLCSQKSIQRERACLGIFGCKVTSSRSSSTHS